MAFFIPERGRCPGRTEKLLAAVLLAGAMAGSAQAETSAPVAACCMPPMPRAMSLIASAEKTALSSSMTSLSETVKSDGATTPPGMVYIPAGEFLMGSNDPAAFPAEKPAHRVRVDAFWIDRTEVTNAEFRKFVEATHYVTTAETTPSLEDIMAQVPPGTPPPPVDKLVPGSLVFTPPDHPVDLNDPSQWWSWTLHADWKHPDGPESSIDGKDSEPVVQVSWDDAQAYARWAHKSLPTEAQWEYAARGGLEGKNFVWGNVFQPKGKFMANTWQGVFPVTNTAEDKYPSRAPVGSFPPNGYGLYDMAGNVWEWCTDWYMPSYYQTLTPGSVSDNPTGPSRADNPQQPYAQEHVIKGGSFLCNVSYCASYRPSARMGDTPDTGMGHLGFRCVQNLKK